MQHFVGVIKFGKMGGKDHWCLDNMPNFSSYIVSMIAKGTDGISFVFVYRIVVVIFYSFFLAKSVV